MVIRAVADNKFIRRYLWIALVGLGIFLWGVYDAAFKFPKELEMAIAFDEIRDQDDADTRWRELYEAHKSDGWDRARPDKPADVIRGYIRFNIVVYVGGGFLLMATFLIKYFRTRGTWMESTETGMATSWGQSLEFDQITRINKRKWEDKGIARVSYTDSAGRQRRLIFDDFKYDRASMSEIMASCEQGLDREKIVGGKTEAEMAAEIAASEAQPEEDESSS